jgi:hypothetical protein
LKRIKHNNGQRLICLAALLALCHHLLMPVGADDDAALALATGNGMSEIVHSHHKCAQNVS